MGQNLGQGSLGITPRVQSGAPFPADAAENGVSVDPNNGRIVLGNDEGDNIAQLLSNREIPMNEFLIRLLGATQQDGQLVLSAGTIDTFLTQTKLNVEGATTTKRRVRSLQLIDSPYDVDPINDAWHVFITETSIE